MIDLSLATNFCKDVCAKCNIDFTIPIVVNNRLTSTIARITYSDISTPSELQLSRTFIENADAAAAHEILIHECAHYIACKKTGIRQGHNGYFKSIVSFLGGNASAATYKMFYKPSAYKYTVYCPNCGFLFGVNRRTKIINNISLYRCKKCKSFLNYTKE